MILIITKIFLCQSYFNKTGMSIRFVSIELFGVLRIFQDW